MTEAAGNRIGEAAKVQASSTDRRTSRRCRLSTSQKASRAAPMPLKAPANRKSMAASMGVRGEPRRGSRNNISPSSIASRVESRSSSEKLLDAEPSHTNASRAAMMANSLEGRQRGGLADGAKWYIQISKCLWAQITVILATNTPAKEMKCRIMKACMRISSIACLVMSTCAMKGNSSQSTSNIILQVVAGTPIFKMMIGNLVISPGAHT